jgi:hypothetical protein
MKNPIRSLALGIALFGAASMVNAQSILTSNSTNNVTESGTIFTFNQFDSSLGSLSAVDLIINSSTIQGSFTLNRTSGSRTYSDFTAALSIDPSFGFIGYDSTALSFNRSPSGDITMSSGNPNQLVSVSGTNQSLIGGSPVTLSIAGPFTSYIGLSTVGFSSALLFGDDNTGSGSTSINNANVISPTSMTLRYTYTPSGPAVVPEPGQVAASLLLLGGIGAYYFVKRRRKSAPAAA